MFRYFNGYVLFPLLERVAKRDISAKLKQLRMFEAADRKFQLETQRANLHKILLHCQNHIPYYKDLFQKHSFHIDKVKKDINFIKDLPILTKAIVRENTDRLKLPNAHHARKTGGSTGQSVHFFYDNEGLDWTSAINFMAYEMVNHKIYKKDCHISSELGIEPIDLKHKFLDWLRLISQNRKRLMVSSFSDVDLARTFEDLKSTKPYLLQGHPSSAFAIADYIKRKKIKTQKYCNIFEPSGEMITPKMAETIQDYLGAKVVNRYGNAEFGVMAHSKLEDPFIRLKVFESAFFIEECNQTNIITSGLTNYGMPLLRYDTGDIATVNVESDGTYIYDIRGRIHDCVTINKKAFPTHFIMDYLDHKVKGVRQFQILLKKGVNPQLNIVSEDIKDEVRIKKEVLKKWPKGLEVNFIQYNDLEKVGWRQKFRHIIDQRNS